MLKIILLFVAWNVFAADPSEIPEGTETKATHEFACKVRGHQICYKTGTECSQLAQTSQSALGCFNAFIDCLNRAIENCENLTEDTRQFIEEAIRNESG